MPAIKFRGVDFIQFDSLLTEEERLVRDTTRKFIEENLIPIIEECNRAGRFPRELVKPMGELGCFGLTEPDFGSNPGGMRTRARKVGKEYVLNGEKMWITSGTIADVAVIW